jgi:hypothetical protein
MNIVTPIILLIISAGLFFGYINPTYRGENEQSVTALRAEQKEYVEAVENTGKIISKRDLLIDKKNNITAENLERLSKLMPNNVDNVRLIVDMDAMAKRYSSAGLKNISINKNIEGDNSNGSNGAQVSNKSVTGYNYLTVGFTITTTYDKFVDFLLDLENNLRLADVTNVSFSSNDNGVYDFSVAVRTYWLK